MYANAPCRKEMTNRNDLQTIITQALEQMKREQGENFDPSHVNLAELERRTGISRARLRRLQKNGFKVLEHASKNRIIKDTVISGYSGVLNALLQQGVTNSSKCFDRIKAQGYSGSLSSVKRYISSHQDLVPPKRLLVDPQGNRGRRYETDPGECYQMDWGFVNVETSSGSHYQAACFAMICHHCGQRYVEFFPNAKQENLFIGMLHAFFLMGLPKYVLTDNMKSVVIQRDAQGHPIWQHDYEVFMETVGFRTKLCKPRHPFTKGKVERLIRFVKENFLTGWVFNNITDLNYEVLRWCGEQNQCYHRSVDCIPDEVHSRSCFKTVLPLEQTKELMYYLCPQRRISFDGFVTYEGRRFGVPFWYTGKTCRVSRKDYTVYIYFDDLSRILTTHDVTWSRRDSYCRDQYVKEQPEEFPTALVKSRIFQIESSDSKTGFEKFNFEEGVWDE